MPENQKAGAPPLATPIREAPEPLYSHIGTRIQYLREGRDLSQDELGSRVGATRALVSMWEHGTCRIPTHRLVDVAFALGVTGGMLLGEAPLLTMCNARRQRRLRERLRALKDQQAAVERQLKKSEPRTAPEDRGQSQCDAWVHADPRTAGGSCDHRQCLNDATVGEYCRVHAHGLPSEQPAAQPPPEP